jgi:hypothetical protein
MMMAFHIYNIIVIERTHAAASILRPNQREKQIISEDLCKPISRLSLWWIPGEGIKTGGTYTSQENTHYFPIFVSLGRFAATNLGGQGEPLSNCGLNGGRGRGDEVPELIGCSNHEGPERWW